MTTEISVIYGSEKVNSLTPGDLVRSLSMFLRGEEAHTKLFLLHLPLQK